MSRRKAGSGQALDEAAVEPRRGFLRLARSVCDVVKTFSNNRLRGYCNAETAKKTVALRGQVWYTLV
jgi:hypothetical protein